jgi:alkaline phosphatase D
MRVFLFTLLLWSFYSSNGQNVIAGPMVGYSAMMEVGLWVQLDGPAKISYKYWPLEHPDQIKETNLSETQPGYWHINQTVVPMLEPGIEYGYELYINEKAYSGEFEYSFKTQLLWQWRTDPPEFSFALGSCNYVSEERYDRPGEPYGGDYHIFNSIHSEDPDFMVWLGDNIYLREVDWDSKSGIYHRYTHTRSLPELQPLLGDVHHYAIWDDHDYGTNDSNKSYVLKDITLQAFKDFWFNSNYHAGGTKGITGHFQWADCEFFMLDNRWERTPAGVEGQIIGDRQMTWLKEQLLTSKASFKFICIGGQFISDAGIFENHANYPSERLELIDFIQKNNIRNIVFLTGDRHHSEISRLSIGEDNYIYDITSSPLTSKAYDHSKEPNNLRVSESIIGQRNYALVNVSGSFKRRVLEISFKDSNGELLYTYTIHKK